MRSSVEKRAEAAAEELPGRAVQGGGFVSGCPELLQPLLGLWV